jgi:hypothetical protein
MFQDTGYPISGYKLLLVQASITLGLLVSTCAGSGFDDQLSYNSAEDSSAGPGVPAAKRIASQGQVLEGRYVAFHGFWLPDPSASYPALPFSVPGIFSYKRFDPTFSKLDEMWVALNCDQFIWQPRGYVGLV